MTYLQATQYLESFINYEKLPAWPYKKSLKLERIKDFLQTLGDPQDSLSCIHVAGTKGKGSTCAFVAYILKEAGYKTGLYTSPHLTDFRERIRILSHQPSAISHQPKEFEGMISGKELSDLVKRLKPEIEKFNKHSKYGPLSFFEVYTALAFVYFKEKKVDFAVLETGLGGRLDATNTVFPLVCAITPISYEHTQKLGNTLREIATEKAGIIKIQNPKSKIQNKSQIPKAIVISAPQEKEAGEVIRNRCKKLGAKLYEVGRDIIFEVKVEDKVKNNSGNYQNFSINGAFGRLDNLKIKLLGEHQRVNAAVAVGIIGALRSIGIVVDAQAVKHGLYNTLWPGRCEVVARNPLIVLDGAQNIASSRVLKKAIRDNFSAKGGSASGRASSEKYKKLILVLGVSSDKDIKGICKELKSLADKIIVTCADNPRACSPAILAKNFNGKPVYLSNNIKEARGLISSLAKKEDLVLVTGSLFVVGEFRDEQVRSR